MNVHKTCIDSLDVLCKKRPNKRKLPFTRPVSTGEIYAGVSSSLYNDLDPSAQLFIKSFLCQNLHSLDYVGTITISLNIFYMIQLQLIPYLLFSTQFYYLPCNDR